MVHIYIWRKRERNGVLLQQAVGLDDCCGSLPNEISILLWSSLVYVVRTEWKRVKLATKSHLLAYINIPTLFSFSYSSHWDKIWHRHGLLYSHKFQKPLQSLLMPNNSVLCSHLLSSGIVGTGTKQLMALIQLKCVLAHLWCKLKPTCTFGRKLHLKSHILQRKNDMRDKNKQDLRCSHKNWCFPLKGNLILHMKQKSCSS